MTNEMNEKTIERRMQEAAGIVAEFIAAARSEELQHKQVQVIIRLANPFLESKQLYNSEIWFSVREEKLRKLETVHMQECSRCTEKYTECGCCNEFWVYKD